MPKASSPAKVRHWVVRREAGPGEASRWWRASEQTWVPNLFEATRYDRKSALAVAEEIGGKAEKVK